MSEALFRDACISPAGWLHQFVPRPLPLQTYVRLTIARAGSEDRGATAIDRIRGNVASLLPTPHPILRLAARQSPPPNGATPASPGREHVIPSHKNWPRSLGSKGVATARAPPRSNTQVISELCRVRCVRERAKRPIYMARSMLMSTSVNGGRALPSPQAGRPARLMLPLRPSYYNHARSVSVRTMALFGKTKTKAAPAKKAAPPPKPKVEDGIFGTSGGIGFTKENELFVGRVAMLGFAASLLGEAITGKGILAQLNLETGIPIYEAEPLLLFFILFTLLGAIGALGDRGRFVDEVTGLDKAVIPPGKGFRSALGLSEGGPLFGFTKSNELFVGRLAQLGVAFSIIGEIITGKGALAQLNIETGVPINEIEPLVLFNVLFFFIAAINPGNGKFVSDEEE